MIRSTDINTMNLVIAADVIEELGGRDEVAKIMGITPNAVSYWKRNGIPKATFRFLKAQFPNLKAWNQKEINQQQAAKDLPNA